MTKPFNLITILKITIRQFEIREFQTFLLSLVLQMKTTLNNIHQKYNNETQENSATWAKDRKIICIHYMAH